MADNEPDYALLDRAGVGFIFFPRPDHQPAPSGATDYLIEAAPDVAVAARFYATNPDLPTVLYFHGNGEVVSDHDEIAPFYHQAGTNLFVAEFRGYGKSAGQPSFANLISDAHAIAQRFHELLDERGFDGRRFVMGRSLGSQPALEIAAHAPKRFKGLIIESGAATVRRILSRVSLDPDVGEGAALVATHDAKIRSIRMRALLIHGERDELVPLAAAAELHDLLAETDSNLVIIPGAGHNDLLWSGDRQYFEAIGSFVTG